ncbi:MAG: hypothetical protein ABI076_10535, partial [Acidobacteriaceae bacterium]
GIEDYFTSSYVGLSHQFSKKLSVEGIAEFIRAFRVIQPKSGIAQGLRPAATVDFSPAQNWNLHASSAYESTRSFHVYDMTQNGISLSYSRPLNHTFNDVTGKVHLKYPLRFEVGVQEETFPNFPQGKNPTTFRPYVSITIF